MVRMNFIFIFISSSDPNLLRKESVKQKIKKTLALATQASRMYEFFKIEAQDSALLFIQAANNKHTDQSAQMCG